MREHFDSKNMQFVDKNSKNSKKLTENPNPNWELFESKEFQEEIEKLADETPQKRQKRKQKQIWPNRISNFEFQKKKPFMSPPHRTPILFWRNIKRWKYHQTPWWERHLVRKEHFLPHSSDIVIIAFVLVCIDLDAERAWMWRAMWPPEQTPTRIRPLLH